MCGSEGLHRLRHLPRRHGRPAAKRLLADSGGRWLSRSGRWQQQLSLFLEASFSSQQRRDLRSASPESFLHHLDLLAGHAPGGNEQDRTASGLLGLVPPVLEAAESGLVCANPEPGHDLAVPPQRGNARRLRRSVNSAQVRCDSLGPTGQVWRCLAGCLNAAASATEQCGEHGGSFPAHFLCEREPYQPRGFRRKSLRLGVPHRELVLCSPSAGPLPRADNELCEVRPFDHRQVQTRRAS
mmetsp:Transcript_55157/g.129510  ORF Transcript_55157/g.129510 Transcript_55157/m.129510 type:complete len:240 (-) Transcript_55157:475-1194(-)